MRYNNVEGVALCARESLQAESELLTQGRSILSRYRPLISMSNTVEYPFLSLSLLCFTVPLARRPTVLHCVGGGGRNEEATGGGAGQSVGQPVGLSFSALSVLRYARAIQL